MSFAAISAHSPMRPRHVHLLFAASLASGLIIMLIGCSSGVNSSANPVTPAPINSSPATSVSVTVTGAAQTRIGESTQFTASVTGAASNAVGWEVNQIAGGSVATGTISATGFYTAPAILPSPNVVTISAVSAAASSPGTLVETLLNPIAIVTSATAMQSGTSSTYTIDVAGSGFVTGAKIQIAGNEVPTAFVSASEVTASIAVASGTTSLAIDVINPSSGGTPSSTVQAAITSVAPTVTSAARLLDQATFGPTVADIQHVQQVGLDGYISEQFQVAPTLLADIPATPMAICTAAATTPCEQSEWWQAVLTGPDQLRQRVAFALSEIFVVSSDSVNPRAVTAYQNILVTDAFTNFATIMHDVTLSPAMGGYLNMLNSNKPASGQIANENYPREFMQLFTTGIEVLNADGTAQLDASSNPVPVYTEAQVQAFARAYTGWTYASSSGGTPSKFPNNTPNYDFPMAAVESAHDTTSKTLLNGTVLPTSQTAEQDLADALSNVFNHPNVGPFICRQLIQHLVASNPRPAYVARVASVFADNGDGIRGDMKAVIRAILEDPDARAGDTDPAFDGGHLREVMLYTTDVLRGLGFINTSTTGDYSSLSNYTSPLGEKPYSSPSVFNFFPPEYVIPGTTVNAPEFGLENTTSATLRLTLADDIVNNRIANFKGDLSATGALGLIASKTGVAAADSANLVDTLGILFMHGLMPVEMRSDIVSHVEKLTNISERVRVATYLVITASQYKIEN